MRPLIRSRVLRGCAAAVGLGTIGVAAWWLTRSPVEPVARLGAPSLEGRYAVHGPWLVRYKTTSSYDDPPILGVRPVAGGPEHPLSHPFAPGDGVGDSPEVAAVTSTDAYLCTIEGARRGREVNCVYRVPFEGGPAVKLASGEDTACATDGAAVLGEHLYWLSAPGSDARAGPCALWRLPVSGGQPRKVLTGRGNWFGVGASGATLTWSDRECRHRYGVRDGRHTVSPLSRAASAGLAEGAREGATGYWWSGPCGERWSLWYCPPDGARDQTVWDGSSAAHRDLCMQHVMGHRGRVYVLLVGIKGESSALCECIVDARGKPGLRTVVRLPAGCGYVGNCDCGYCWLQRYPFPPQQPGRWDALLARLRLRRQGGTLLRIKLPA